MNQQPRPLRELCQELTIVELVRAGLPQWGNQESSIVRTLGPESRGIRTRRLFDPGCVSVTARMERSPGGFARATIKIGHPFPGYVWADEVAVKIPPYRHWLLCCQGCNRRCRVLLFPPRGKEWRCRRCLHVRYPDKRRINSLPARPNAPDELDRLERDIRRLRLIEKEVRRMTMSRPRKPTHDGDLDFLANALTPGRRRA